MVELIFSHIPKTAGKSISAALKELYGPTAIAEDYNVRMDGASDPACAYLVARQLYEQQAQTFVDTMVKPETKVIIGHFPFSKYMGFFPKAKRACCVRHPAERMWSTYWYWKQISPTTSPLQALVSQGAMSFELLIGHPMMRNQQVDYFFSGAKWDEWDDDGGAYVIQHEHIDVGWRGLQEDLGFSQDKWASITLPPYPPPCRLDISITIGTVPTSRSTFLPWYSIPM